MNLVFTTPHQKLPAGGGMTLQGKPVSGSQLIEFIVCLVGTVKIQEGEQGNRVYPVAGDTQFAG